MYTILPTDDSVSLTLLILLTIFVVNIEGTTVVAVTVIVVTEIDSLRFKGFLPLTGVGKRIELKAPEVVPEALKGEIVGVTILEEVFVNCAAKPLRLV